MTKTTRKPPDILPKYEWMEGVSGLGIPSYHLLGDGFWVSYTQVSGFDFMDSDGGGDETALCDGKDYFILNGDYREEYLKLAPKGLAACKKFYDKQDSKSSWSD